ncbi:MAG: hypothetical protein PHF18_15650 [Methanosarcina sp.]|nr:hypothetical protein [Methanosarcina sp.]MDD3248263.1 hypothetical protein [Methanosarcina sp.]
MTCDSIKIADKDPENVGEDIREVNETQNGKQILKWQTGLKGPEIKKI